MSIRSKLRRIKHVWVGLRGDLHDLTTKTTPYVIRFFHLIVHVWKRYRKLLWKNIRASLIATAVAFSVGAIVGYTAEPQPAPKPGTPEAALTGAFNQTNYWICGTLMVISLIVFTWRVFHRNQPEIDPSAAKEQEIARLDRERTTLEAEQKRIEEEARSRAPRADESDRRRAQETIQKFLEARRHTNR